MPKKKKERHPLPLPVLIIILLLLGQFALYLAFNIWTITPYEAADLIGLTEEEFVDLALNLILTAVLLALLDGLIAFTIMSILRRWRSAWVNAMLVQGATLGIGLTLYFVDEPWEAPYILMIYGVVVVIYLMLPGVQAAFLPPGGEA